MASGEQDAEAPTKTGGATSGGPPASGSESTGTDYSKVKKSAGEDQKEDGNRHRMPANKEESGEMGLGSESGALGGGESPRITRIPQRRARRRAPTAHSRQQ